MKRITVPLMDTQIQFAYMLEFDPSNPFSQLLKFKFELNGTVIDGAKEIDYKQDMPPDELLEIVVGIVLRQMLARTAWKAIATENAHSINKGVKHDTREHRFS